MSSRQRRTAALLGIVVLGGVLVVTAGRLWPGLATRRGGSAGALQASGVIGVSEVIVAPSLGGKVGEVLVAEGDPVRQGQVLLRLDPALLDAQIAVAAARAALAEAALAQVQAGARPGLGAVAEAQLDQARAARQGAAQAFEDAKGMLAHPQELDLQVAVAEAQVEAEKFRLASASALKDAAETAKNLADYSSEVIRTWSLPAPAPKLPHELTTATWDWWKAWAGVSASRAAVQAAEEQLAYWREVRGNPQQLNARVEAAEAALEAADASMASAQAQLDGYRAGASAEQVSAARARVAQARAALKAQRAQRAELDLVAPMDGVVLEQDVRAGETVAPGAPLLALADLSTVRVTVYVAESQLGQVALGQSAAVAVDSFPGRWFEGQIERIADQPQFTPRNVATKEQRVNTVFAVDIRVDNADGVLKPGMAADVVVAR